MMAEFWGLAAAFIVLGLFRLTIVVLLGLIKQNEKYHCTILSKADMINLMFLTPKTYFLQI